MSLSTINAHFNQLIDLGVTVSMYITLCFCSHETYITLCKWK